MPKIKLPTKSPNIDMTPMVDLFSLLLTFFMLTTSFRPQEAKQIDTPSSVSEKQSPDNNVMTILISKDNKVFFNIDNGKDSSTNFRSKVLEEMSKQYNIKFSKEEVDKFGKLASFGMPLQNLKRWIHSQDPAEKEALQSGIPFDTTKNVTNQLNSWILYSRRINQNFEVAIKGDAEADYKLVKQIFKILQDNEVVKFNLTTNLMKAEVKPSDIK